MRTTLNSAGFDGQVWLTTCKSRLRHWRDELWDRRLGVRTFGVLAAVGSERDPDWQVHYEPARYSDLIKMLRFVGVNRDDVFLDLGSGLGRAVFVARHLGVRQARGIEINRSLHARSLDNLKRARSGDGGVSFICGPAQEYSDTDTTLVYLFNPFGAGTLRCVLSALRASYAVNPRKIRLIYFNPLFDQVLEDSGLLKLVQQWPGNTEDNQAYCKYKVSFWESIDA